MSVKAEHHALVDKLTGQFVIYPTFWFPTSLKDKSIVRTAAKGVLNALQGLVHTTCHLRTVHNVVDLFI
jgi:hypothetical protein